MAHDSKRLTLIVSQAAHHLHAVVGNVATALLDTSQNPRMLFSNSALSQISGITLVSLAREYALKGCQEFPCTYKHVIEGDETVLYLTILDERHVFVVIGTTLDEQRVQEFNSRLKMLLPPVVVS